jgi:protein-L-isoaspartate(D-aspartate) O-methyltransferase
MSTAADVSARIDRLADYLAARHVPASPQWRRLLHAVPRHLFVPARAFAVPGAEGAPAARAIDRDADPASWWDAVYSDMAVITQRDDGAGDPGTPQGLATCSLSAPGVAISFLELLGPRPGQRILEIGTGTGWTAAILTATGASVTSIDIDPALLATARTNLHAAGYTPRLVGDDGADGVPGEVFDRLHVTCGVSQIPYAWIAQLVPGGVAVLPWLPDAQNGYQVRLVARDDGTAAGTFHGPAGYMMLRAQRTGPTLWHPHHTGDADTTTTTLDPRDIVAAGDAARLALTQVPGLVLTTRPDDDGSLSIHLAEAGHPDRSWAACDSGPDGLHAVTQYGPRRLWDETEHAFTTWTAAGRPGPDKFRLLITPDGQQVQQLGN